MLFSMSTRCGWLRSESRPSVVVRVLGGQPLETEMRSLVVVLVSMRLRRNLSVVLWSGQPTVSLSLWFRRQ